MMNRRNVLLGAGATAAVGTDLVGPSATPPTRHRIGEPLGVRAGSVQSGLRHEYLPATA